MPARDHIAWTARGTASHGAEVALGVPVAGLDERKEDKAKDNITSSVGVPLSRSTSPFVLSLLQSCNTTLEFLTLCCAMEDDPLSFGHEQVDFPHLRFLDASTLKSTSEMPAVGSAHPSRERVRPLRPHRSARPAPLRLAAVGGAAMAAPEWAAPFRPFRTCELCRVIKIQHPKASRMLGFK